MIALLAAIGWGLLSIGALTHIWHHRRLRRLLGQHLDHERWPALALTVTEAFLVVGIAWAYLAQGSVLVPLALAGAAIALGFVAWIARLLLNGSTLPCACSFSEAPTTIWSLARAACVGLVVLFAAVEGRGTLSTALATLAVGMACAAAIFVVPEAVIWPNASRALMARVDGYETP